MKRLLLLGIYWFGYWRGKNNAKRVIRGRKIY